MKSRIWIISALLIALLALVTMVSAQIEGEEAPDSAQPATFEEALAAPLAGTGIVSEPKGATGSAVYLIRLSDPPVASYRGGIPGLEATNPGVQGQRKLDMNSAEAVAYRDYLLAKQSQLITNIEQTLGRSVEVAFQYYAANNGIAAHMTPEEAREVSKLPGVIFIQRNFERELHTDNGPTWIGAPAIWGGTQTTRDFYANLDGSQEVPPNGSSATGEGTFAYDFETMELSWNISHTGLVSITAAHIHSATVGVNGGIQITLDHTLNPIVGSATLTAAQEWALVNGRFYVNIHTAAFPGGEIRGQIWQTGSMGEGIIIGVIDTGINPSNPSFADLGGDSYDHTNPWGSGTYVGVCDPGNPTYDPTFPCNDKLIGAWGYPTVNGGDPRDYDGHGSHTASTAGGNFLDEAPVVAPTLTITPSISGVAPHANIVAYSACCTAAALTAAIDQIVIDGVDVVNYSIGSSSPSDLWNDFDTVGYLNARDAGIFVVTSAGNDGPGSETVGSPADAPWLTSVGASTHGRSFLNVVENMTGGDTTPPADIEGKGLTIGYGPAPIVYAGDFGDALCLNPFPGGTWTNGEIVVCDRGINARVAKGQNVLAGGAGGMVLTNVAANGEGFGTLNGDSHFLPAVHIANADGIVLKTWLASGTGHMATISGVSFSGAYGDIMAGFSSRGANRAAPDIIVPSVSAPGVDIIAATGVGDAVEWNVISGTSMASPHTAGAGALMMAIYPEWSPAEIQSALMSTAYTGMLDNDGVTAADPFDTGSGRVDLSTAMSAGLVLDETTDNYWAADPSLGGDVKTLNLASLGNNACVGSCGWTRTVSSTLSIPVTWTVSTNGGFPISVTPGTFVLDPGATQTLVITADVSAEVPGSWLFAEVMLSPDDGGVSTAHFPVAVVPQAGEIPDNVEIDARRDAGSDLVRDITALEITDLTIESFGLVQGDQYDFQLDEDSTNGDPYDNLNEVWWITMTVPAGAHRLVAEVVDSTAVDIDLYVGTGSTPSAGTQVCASTSATFVEYCNVDDPTASTWWVLAQNWAEGTPPDDVTTIVGLVEDADAGNLTVTGPASVPGGTPFDLRVFWDEGQMDTGEYWYGAFSIGTDAGNPGNIGTVNVDVDRLEDDVIKTANQSVALPGDTITYTITVLPNELTEDITYWLTDTIPAGMTYVPGSASATAGSVAVSGNQVTWTGMQSSPYGAASNYVMTTSNNDPNCDTGFGGYVNLQDFGILAQATIVGDTVTFVAFSTGDPINYYGSDYTGMGFTDDGFAIADPATNNGGSPWVPQFIPDANLPNNVLPVYWNDFELFYDSAANQGVSLATSGAPGGVIIIEYDDIEPFGGGTPVMDFEIIMARAIDDSPGAYEIVYAYDNVASTPSTATIGVENQPGDAAVALVNDGDPSGIVTDGFMVCFDLQGPQLDPITITYAVSVDAGASGTLTNSADSSTSTPGSTLASTSVDVIIPAYAVQVAAVDDALSGAPGSSVMYTIWVTNTGNVTDTFDITALGVWVATTSSSSVTLGAGESTSVMVTVDIPASAGDGDSDVTAVTATSQTDSSATASVDLTTTAIVGMTYIYLPIILRP